MYGIIRVRMNHDKTKFLRDWVKLPNGERVKYSWRDHATEIACGMSRHATDQGINGVSYRIKEIK